MKKSKSLIVAGVIMAASLIGGSGAALAATGTTGGHRDTNHSQAYRTPHRTGDGPDEKGLIQSKDDSGPGLQQEGTPPKGGGQPETHSYRAR